MRVVIAGSSGLIGSPLVQELRSAGHDVSRLVRREPRSPDEIGWGPETFGLTDDTLAGVDAVINLCGVGIASRPWSGQFKQELRDSRIIPTQVLADAIVEHRVPVFVSASATGFYGFTGDDERTESSPRGSGFLADLSADWERTAALATSARVALLRTAPVFSRSGGLLGPLRPLFTAGLGARLGDGSQWFPWITLADHVRAVRHVLEGDVSGPVNITSPQPVTNAEFTAAFGRAVHRPAFLRVPRPVLRVAGGELALEMLLGGQRAVPTVLAESGFTFTHATIDDGLRWANGSDS
ncbi:TIGR01777 family oxidoreductase [Williamsia sp. SKLECPSW1]